MDGSTPARPQRRAHAAAALSDRMDGCDHLPERPAWDCGACGQPWPCSPARVRLAEAYRSDRVGLAMYLWCLLEEAAAEASTEIVGPAELYERFVVWTDSERS